MEIGWAENDREGRGGSSRGGAVEVQRVTITEELKHPGNGVADG